MAIVKNLDQRWQFQLLCFVVLKVSHRLIVSIRHTSVAHSKNTDVQPTGLYDLQALRDRTAGFRPELLHPLRNFIHGGQQISRNAAR